MAIDDCRKLAQWELEDIDEYLTTFDLNRPIEDLYCALLNTYRLRGKLSSWYTLYDKARSLHLNFLGELS